MRYLKQFDQFSVNYQSYIHKGDNEYKSIFGAISSIIIYISASLFIFWQIYLWQTNQFLPTIVETNQISNRQIVIFKQIEIDFDPYKIFSFDFFDVNKKIFLPMILPLCNNNFCEQQTQNGSFKEIITNNRYTVQNLNISNQISSNIINEYYISFNLCNNLTSANSPNNCASDFQIDEYFNQNLWIQIKQLFQNMIFKQNRCKVTINHTGQIQIKKNLFIQKLILWLAKHQQMRVQFYQLRPFTIIYLLLILILWEVYDELYPFALDIFLDELYLSQNIQYPMLGSVLANAGSIVSLIF